MRNVGLLYKLRTQGVIGALIVDIQALKNIMYRGCMMNVDEKVDDLKDYVGTTCILEARNPATL